MGVIVGLLAAALLALLLGIPTLRLRADYLAIVTIAAGEICASWRGRPPSIRSPTAVHGVQAFADDFFSINPIPAGRYGFGRFSFDARALWVLTVMWLIAWCWALCSFAS